MVNNGLPVSNYFTIAGIVVNPQNAITYMPGVPETRAFGTSTDDGASWTESGPGAFFNNLVLDPGALNTLYAAGRGIYKSTDGGANWSAVSSGLPDGYRTLALTIDPRIPGTIYAVLGLAKASLEMPQGECCEYLQGEKLR